MSEQQQNQFITYEQLQRQYFLDLINLKRKKNHREVSHGENRIVVNRVVDKIQSGIFEIRKIESKVEDLLEQKQLTEQQKKMIHNQKVIEEKTRQNQLLYPKDKSLETLEPEQYPPNILSAEKHKQFIRQIKMEKSKRQRRMSKIKNIQIKNKQKSFTQFHKEEEKQRIQQIEKKKLKIQQNLQKMRQNHEKLLLNESQTKQLINRIHKKKRLDQYLKQTFEQRYVRPLLQQNKKILEQRKEHTRLSLEQIQTHEKQYLEWKKSQQSLQKSSLSKNSYRPPPHSKKINMILAEQELKKHTIQIQKQAIKQKILRVHSYTSNLKERRAHKPIVSKTIQTSDRQKSQKTQISQIDSGKRYNLGNKYLQQARKVARKRANTQEGQKSLTIQIDQRNSNIKQKTRSSNAIKIKNREKSIQKSKKYQIQRLLNCKEMAPQQQLNRIQQADKILSIELKKTQQRLKLRYSTKDNRSSVQLMLATVRAKMNLLSYFEGVHS